MKVNFNGLDHKLKELVELRDVQNVVRMNTAELENKAKRRVPVDTGNLRRMITMDLRDGGLTGVVKADTNYSGYVEYGTRYQSAQPYLRPATFEQNTKFVQDLFRIMK